MSNLWCTDLRKCSICFVCMYERKESGPCPPGNNWFFLGGVAEGKRKVLEIICQVWLKITCGQSLWRQKMIEVSNCYFIYSFYIHVRRWIREENPFLLDGGKGAEQGGCFHRSSGHCSVLQGSCCVPVLCSCPNSATALGFSFLRAIRAVVDCGCYALL